MTVHLKRALEQKTHARLTDEEALRLTRGCVVYVDTLIGMAPLTVEVCRQGVAFDDAVPPQPYAVPVIEGRLATRAVLVYSVDDCYREIEPDEQPTA